MHIYVYTIKQVKVDLIGDLIGRFNPLFGVLLYYLTIELNTHEMYRVVFGVRSSTPTSFIEHYIGRKTLTFFSQV